MSDRTIVVLIICVAVCGTVTGFLAAVLAARGITPPPFLALLTGSCLGALVTLLLRVEIKKKNGDDAKKQ